VRRIKVFVISLVAVLILGTALMVVCMMLFRGVGENTTSGIQENVIDFSWIGGSVGSTGSADTGNGALGDDVLSGEVEASLSESELLYEEAVNNGENAYLVECADEGTVTFAFAGDVLLDDNYAMMYKYKLRGSSIEDTFSASLLERMRSADAQ
jgi:hypothetical protein